MRAPSPDRQRQAALERSRVDQPLMGATQAWTVADAHDGVLCRGEIRVAELGGRQPWEVAAV